MRFSRQQLNLFLGGWRPLVLVVGVVLGIVVHPLFYVLGPIAYAITVAIAASQRGSTAITARALREDRGAAAFGKFRPYVVRARGVRGKIAQTAQQARAGVDVVLGRVMPDVDELVGGVIRLANQARAVQRFLASQNPAGLEQQVRQLESQAATDPNLAKALEQRREQMDIYRDLEGRRDSLVGQMEQLLVALDDVHSQVMAIAVAGTVSDTPQTQALTQYLSVLRQQFEESEQQMAGDTRLAAILGTERQRQPLP